MPDSSVEGIARDQPGQVEGIQRPEKSAGEHPSLRRRPPYS